jgi:hypothetical protein
VLGVDKAYDAIMNGEVPYHPSIMFRNNTSLRYRSKAILCEDMDFYLQAFERDYKIDNIPDFLLKYRLHGKSVSIANTFKQRWFVEQIKRIHLEKVETGIDKYDEFDVAQWNEQPHPFPGSEDDLLVQIQHQIVMQNFKAARKFCNEYFNKYGFNKRVSAYFALSLLPVGVAEAIKTQARNTKKYLASRKKKAEELEEENS